MSRKGSARLAIGIRYPIDYTLEEINGYTINGELETKLYKNGKLVESNLINRIDKTWLDFQSSGYKVSVFHTFVWSPNVIIKPKGRLEINLKGTFKNLDIIIFDAGIK